MRQAAGFERVLDVESRRSERAAESATAMTVDSLSVPSGVLHHIPARPRLSSTLLELCARGSGTVSCAALLERLGDRGFVLSMLLLAIPNLVVFLPGPSLVTGLVLIVVAFQLAAGAPALRLPAFLRDRPIDPAALARGVELVLPALRRLERMVRPRRWPSASRAVERLVGLVALLMALFMFLPIPFANTLPAIAVALLALALGERLVAGDGDHDDETADEGEIDLGERGEYRLLLRQLDGPPAPALSTVRSSLFDTLSAMPYRSLQHLREQGEVIDEALLAALSPLGRDHINLTGDYVWSSKQTLKAGEYRARRAPADR